MASSSSCVSTPIPSRMDFSDSVMSDATDSFVETEKQSQRLCVTYKDSWVLDASTLLERGRSGLWSKSERLFESLHFQLGFRVVDPYSVDDTVPVSPHMDTLYAACHVVGNTDHTFTAIIHVHVPDNQRVREVIHRWDVTPSTSRTPFFPIGRLEECYHNGPNQSPDHKKVWVIMELAVFASPRTRHQIAQVMYQQPQLPSNQTVEFVFNDQTAIGEFKCYVDRQLLFNASPYFVEHFLTNDRFIVQYNLRQDMQCVLRFVVYRIVPRASEVTKNLFAFVAQLKMRELERVLHEVHRPACVRYVSDGYVQVFDHLGHRPNTIGGKLFDTLLGNGRVQQPLTLAALSLCCMSPLSLREQPDELDGMGRRRITFGDLGSTIKLAGSILRTLQVNNPPQSTSPPTVNEPSSSICTTPLPGYNPMHESSGSSGDNVGIVEVSRIGKPSDVMYEPLEPRSRTDKLSDQDRTEDTSSERYPYRTGYLSTRPMGSTSSLIDIPDLPADSKDRDSSNQ